MTSWLDTSNAWYDAHTDHFAKGAAACDPSKDLILFSQNLKPHASILDVGCGTGRDIAWLAQKGFQTEGLEPSKNLAKLAAKTGSVIYNTSLDAFQPSKRYDAVWCMAVLVHMPLHTWQDTLNKIASLLAPNGIAHIHVKEGAGEHIDGQGRPLALISEAELLKMAQTIPHTSYTLRRQIANTSTGEHVSWITLELTQCA